jgi:hypothetical protein
VQPRDQVELAGGINLAVDFVDAQTRADRVGGAVAVAGGHDYPNAGRCGRG